MGKITNIVLISTTLIIGLAGTSYLLARPHLWNEVSEARVFLDGQYVAEASIYRSSEGQLLVRLEDDSLFIFNPSIRDIGLPSRSAFVFLPTYAFSTDLVPPPVVMSGNKVKVEHDMNIVVGSNGFELTNSSGVRIAVELPAE